jgi:hypothetical protein
MQALLLGALAEARIAPQVAVRFRSGAPPHCEIVRYGDGPVEYVGVLRDFEESAPDEVAEVRFGRKANVYDVRARRFLGKTDKVTAVLAAGQVKLYALLARPPGSIGLQIEPPGKPGDPVRYTVQLGPEKMERTRIVRVVVRKPTGEAFAPYGATLRVAPGQRTAQGRFRPALNDPLGRWQITATDVATGLFAQGAF